MYRIIFTVTGFLLPPSVQHFISPPTWCQLATLCNHTGIPECAQEIKQGNDFDIRLFMDECDMFEYNCDNLKEYNKVDMVTCQKTSSPTSITTLATTLSTTTAPNSTSLPPTINKITTQTTVSATNAIEPKDPPTITSTQQCTRDRNSTTPMATAIQNITSIIPVETTLPTIKNCTRNTNQATTTENESIKELSSTTLLKSTSVATLDTSTITAATNNMTIITSLVTSSNNVSNNCTRNSNQTLTTASSLLLALTPTYESSTDSTSFLCTCKSSSTAHISTSVSNVIEPTILPIDDFTKQTPGPISSNCTRHNKSINPVTTSIISTSPLTTLSMIPITTEPIPLTTPFTTEMNKNYPAADSTVSDQSNCTRNDNNISITTITTLISKPRELNTTKQLTESMTMTAAFKTECEKYPKECKRPSTWETTVQGETRDFFQILRAKFGSRVKFLRATTHWPLRAPFFINDGNFVFGRHSET